jgi:hypothetical protein
MAERVSRQMLRKRTALKMWRSPATLASKIGTFRCEPTPEHVAMASSIAIR